MPVLVFVAAIFVLYLIAKVLIPVLATILKLFLLLTAIAPYLLFIGIGAGIGILLSDFHSDYRSKKKEKWF